jgi:cell division protein FtsN
MKQASRMTVGLAMGVIVLALLACKKKEESSSTGSTSSGASGGDIGVPECDEYLTKYEKCLNEKVPAVARPAMQDAFKKQRETYKTLASNPATKSGMATGCKQALETAKTAMSSYGCTW